MQSLKLLVETLAVANKNLRSVRGCRRHIIPRSCPQRLHGAVRMRKAASSWQSGLIRPGRLKRHEDLIEVPLSDIMISFAKDPQRKGWFLPKTDLPWSFKKKRSNQVNYTPFFGGRLEENTPSGHISLPLKAPKSGAASPSVAGAPKSMVPGWLRFRWTSNFPRMGWKCFQTCKKHCQKIGPPLKRNHQESILHDWRAILCVCHPLRSCS